MNNVYPMYPGLPTALIFFPAYSCSDGIVYGMVPITPESNFFKAMKDHLRHAVAFVEMVDARDFRGKGSKSSMYAFLVSTYTFGACFLQSDAAEVEEHFRGVTDFETLLRLTASDLLNPRLEDVAVVLDPTRCDDARPIIVDFAAWHQHLGSNGWYQGSIQELWGNMQNICTVAERFEIILPNRLGKSDPFDREIYFRFTAEHGAWTESVRISEFVAAFEDVSRLGK